MIAQGFVLMGAGMGVVGLFLTIMVVVMYGASAVLRRFDKEPADKGQKAQPRKKVSGDDARLAAAVAAARARSGGEEGKTRE